MQHHSFSCSNQWFDMRSIHSSLCEMETWEEWCVDHSHTVDWESMDCFILNWFRSIHSFQRYYFACNSTSREGWSSQRDSPFDILSDCSLFFTSHFIALSRWLNGLHQCGRNRLTIEFHRDAMDLHREENEWEIVCSWNLLSMECADWVKEDGSSFPSLQTHQSTSCSLGCAFNGWIECDSSFQTMRIECIVLRLCQGGRRSWAVDNDDLIEFIDGEMVVHR